MERAFSCRQIHLSLMLMEGSGLHVDVSSTLVVSPQLDPGLYVLRVLELPFWGLGDFIWNNAKEIVAAVLAESCLSDKYTCPAG